MTDMAHGRSADKVWLKSINLGIKKQKSYLKSKWMYKKRVWKNFRGSCKLLQAQEKVCDKRK